MVLWSPPLGPSTIVNRPLTLNQWSVPNGAFVHTLAHESVQAKIYCYSQIINRLDK